MANKGLPDQTRREFVRTAAYVAPVIMTLKAAPALAQNGSTKPEEEEEEHEEEQEHEEHEEERREE
jgi:hypothetical protein